MKKLLRMKFMLLLCALVAGGNVWADTVTFDYADYKDEGTTSTGSEYTMVKTDVSIKDTKFYGNNSQAHFYAGGVTTITPSANVTITGITLTATSTSYNGYQSSGTVTASTGDMSHDGATVTWSGSATSAFTISHSKQIRWTSIVVTYTKAAAHTITAQSNNESYGTVSLSGSVITGSPKSGCRYATPAYTVTEGTATVSQDGNAFTVTPSTDCTVTINFEPITKYAVHWSVNGNVVRTDNVEEDTAIEFPTAIDGVPAGYTLTGWVAESNKINTPTDTDPKANYVTSANATEEVTYYAVMAVLGSYTPASWSEATLASLTASDVFVIVGNNGDDYAMTNNNGTSGAPAAASVTIGTGKITSIVSDNLKWNISGNASDGYTFYPNGSTTTWLYCTNTNNGVRVGDSANNTFTVDQGYLKNVGQSRYIGIYNSQDWRCYTTINSNITGQTFAYYKYVAPVANYSGFCTTVPASVTVSAANYATFCDNVARDFSTSGITVYTAKSNGTTVDLTEVADGIVPANTGVVLYYNGGTTAEIPAAATDKTTLADNELIGINEVTKVKYVEGSKKNFILSNESGVVGFYKAAADGANLAAHRAYLSTENVTAARSFLGFADDETTGISATLMNSEESTVNNVFDLQGRRVAQPTKGLYIVNGKKVVIK